MWLLPFKLSCVTLWHMSIGAGIIISVAFQQVDDTPDTETSAQSYNESFQNSDSLSKKFHKL